LRRERGQYTDKEFIDILFRKTQELQDELHNTGVHLDNALLEKEVKIDELEDALV